MALTGKAPRRWPAILGLALGMLSVALAFAAGATWPEEWALAARWTARAAFLAFLPPFVARPLARLAPSPATRALLRDRRWWGIGFAIAFTIHVVALGMNIALGGREMGPVEWAGGLVYGVIVAMLATSNGAAMRRLGQNWKRLHLAGMWIIWATFTQAYLGRIFDDAAMIVGVFFGSVALGAAAIRFIAWRGRARIAQA